MSVDVATTSVRRRSVELPDTICPDHVSGVPLEEVRMSTEQVVPIAETLPDSNDMGGWVL